MNNLTFIAMLLTTSITIFYLGYLFGRETEQDHQEYAKRIRDTYERN